jgi:hypothetical protein
LGAALKWPIVQNRCDGVPHCLSGEDENDCLLSAEEEEIVMYDIEDEAEDEDGNEEEDDDGWGWGR